MIDPCSTNIGLLNNTVPNIHNLTALQLSNMINQCHLDYDRAKDASKYWYKASSKPACIRVVSNLSTIKGEYYFHLIVPRNRIHLKLLANISNI